MRGDFLLGALVFVPMLGAIVSYIIDRFTKIQKGAAMTLICALELALAAVPLTRVMMGQSASFYWDGFCGMGLHFKLDGFRAMYVMIAAFMWFMSQGLFAPCYFPRSDEHRSRYDLFTLLTLGETCGVFLADNLYTAFIFFELMSMTSYVWVAHDEKPAALRAAETYMAVAVISGMVTLMGLFMLYSKIGTLEFVGIRSLIAAGHVKPGELRLIAALIAVGFAAKAGVFPLHIWLPKAHPVAPAPASALLSGILTKTGLFGLLVIAANMLPADAAWGNAMLIFGVITMFVGALLALFSVDLKRTLACSSMSQIGFILVGVGMAVLSGFESGAAVHGALLHMVNHSLIKLVLFMAAGAVYMQTHKLNLNDIRGFGRRKPLLHFAFLMGYLGIIGMPLFNGYVSKSLLHESILEHIEALKAAGLSYAPYKLAEIIFLVTGGLTAAYMTKLYIALFWEKNDEKTQAAFDRLPPMPRSAAAALTLSALVLPALGMISAFSGGVATLMSSFLHFAGEAENIGALNAENLSGAAKSLLIGAGVYLLIVRPLLMEKDKRGVRLYIDRWPKALDLENLVYRPLLEKLLPDLLAVPTNLLDKLADYARAVLGFMGTFMARVCDEGIDTVALGLWRTLFRRRRKKQPVPIGNRFTYALGSLFNGVVFLLNRTLCRRHPITTNFTCVFAAGFDELSANVKRITLSISFGLLLLCIGLYIAFSYILH